SGTPSGPASLLHSKSGPNEGADEVRPRWVAGGKRRCPHDEDLGLSTQNGSGQSLIRCTSPAYDLAVLPRGVATDHFHSVDSLQTWRSHQIRPLEAARRQPPACPHP